MKFLKNAKTGNIVKVSNEQACQISGREWLFVSKTEGKTAIREPQPVVKPTKTISDSIIRGFEGETVSEKQLKRKKK